MDHWKQLDYLHYSVVGILGAGLMGAGIGQVTLDKGMKTILKDMNDAGIARGLAQIQTGIDAKVKRKKISRVEGERLVSGIVATANISLALCLRLISFLAKFLTRFGTICILLGKFSLL